MNDPHSLGVDAREVGWGKGVGGLHLDQNNDTPLYNYRGGYRVSERGGVSGNCSVLKYGIFARTCETFSPSL